MAEGDGPSESREDTKPRSLIQRLAAIRKECSGVGKETIKMGSFTINGHTIEGVLHGVRALFDRHGVMMIPQLVERTYGGNRCDVIVDFEFINMDDMEDTKTIRWAGADTDNGGKGFAKAGTNALKEMLKKTFLITDREDAKEETEQTEYQSDENLKRAEFERTKEENRKTMEVWAGNLKKAIEATGTSAGVKTLKRENAEQLANLPAVTRAFFDDLFNKRENFLKEVEKKEAAENAETLE